MLQIYLPIAGVYVGLLPLTAVGIITGLLAGMFGVGGTFFTIPMLTIMGIPASVAISSCAVQMVSSAASLYRFHRRRGNIDSKLAFITFMGAVVGSILGGQLFSHLEEINQLNNAVACIYIFVLGSIAIYMLQESLKAIRARNSAVAVQSSDVIYNFFRKWPLPILLEKQNVYVSMIMVSGLGFCSSIIVALAGLSGGFIMIPTFIYVLRIPTAVALGTSNMIGFGNATMSSLIQCLLSRSVDLVLAFILIASSVVGARIGTRIHTKIPSEELRLTLSLIMICLIVKFLWQMFTPFGSLFSFSFPVS